MCLPLIVLGILFYYPKKEVKMLNVNPFKIVYIGTRDSGYESYDGNTERSSKDNFV